MGRIARKQMSSTVRTTEEAHRPGWLRGVFSDNKPQYFTKLPELDLRRIGQMHPPPSNASYLAEEFRIIKRRLLSVANSSSAAAERPDPRIVAVTGAKPREGKTFIAYNLAMSLAIDPTLQVTLIDADILTQGLSRKLDLMSKPGMVDLLHEGPSAHLENFVQETDVKNLQILPAGGYRPEGPELLSTDGMKSLLQTLLAGSPNPFIVIDCRSVLSGSNSIALAEQAGQVLFVIGSAEASRTEVRQSLRILDGLIGPLDEAQLGFVLNKADPSVSAARFAGQ